ncbi:uncharacterized protein C8R40DRAFT_889048 [Lentinula edodes]|uniref:uncharacterized protein n=1 Tax=Lentinula edodes TaxID=5353 RepID=UPI001E8E4FC4|nr:uncharacterized protein C8R40DRAFT_889048 [Lentinula edodes]KAH7867917.1 hypothetical protein C8R40DRAFT_889048 [Lentinula edodes]
MQNSASVEEISQKLLTIRFSSVWIGILFPNVCLCLSCHSPSFRRTEPHAETKPSNLHLPQFTYSIPEAKVDTSERPSEEFSQPFAFSALFQSSAASSSPGLSIFHDTPSFKGSGPLSESSTSAASFIGFSWGPTKDAFPDVHMTENAENEQRSPTGLSPAPLPKWNSTPRPLRIPSAWLTPTPQGRSLPQPISNMARLTTPSIPSHAHAFSTPVRPTTTGIR